MTEVRPGRPFPLGATPIPGAVRFAVAAPNARRIEVCLAAANGGEHRVALPGRTGDVWHGEVSGVAPGDRYAYRADGPFSPADGHWFNPAKRLIDPWARAVDGLVDSDRHDLTRIARRDAAGVWEPDPADSAAAVPWCVVVAPEAATPSRPAVPWPDTVVYEAHVRGLTMRHPDVPAHRRGTFAGVGSDAIVAHLTSLGVTTLQLLPVAQYADESHLVALGLPNYWGYSPVAFGAPHAAYASGGTDGAQVAEFRAMTDALHRAGIEVILDVVYNHTAEGASGGTAMSLRGLDSAAYFRLDPADRSRDLDPTGTGGALDLSSPSMLRLALDAMRIWVVELGVDGFRFDLATTLARSREGSFDAAAPFLLALAQDPVLAQVKLVAEPWDVGEGGYRLGGFPAGWAEWNDRFRDDVRDFWRGVGGVSRLATRLSGSSDVFARPGRSPWASVNFVTAHDGFTLADLVTYEEKRNEANGEGNRDGASHNRSWNCGVEGPSSDPSVVALRTRQRRNLLATLAVSLGVPMILGGDEIGRTQGGNNNAYCQDSAVSWLDWAAADEVEVEFVRRLLAIRRAHPVLRRETFLDGTHSAVPEAWWFREDGRAMAHRDWEDPERRTLGMLLHARPGALGAILHAGSDPTEVRMPARRFGPRWRVILATDDPDRAGEVLARGSVGLTARSVVLLESA